MQLLKILVKIAHFLPILQLSNIQFSYIVVLLKIFVLLIILLLGYMVTFFLIMQFGSM